MADDSERRQAETRSLIREVRSQIWAWDPIGLVPLGVPDDEYDCLIGPVTHGLHDGLSSEALADRLARFVRSHFGTDGSGTEEFADAILTWHRATNGDLDVE